MRDVSGEGRRSGFGARLLIMLLGSIVVLAGVTAAHASGGWPPAGVLLAVGVLLVFLFGAPRLMEEAASRPKEVRAQAD